MRRHTPHGRLLTPGEVRGHDLILSCNGKPAGPGDGFAQHGRIFKTPHPPRSVSDEGHRRLIGARLNVTETRHRLTRRIFFGQRGELRSTSIKERKQLMTLITTPFAARATAAEVLAGVDLTGRRMIVTGGASGLGTETVRALAGAGAHVTIATRNPALAKPILDEFPNIEVAALDLADLESVRAFCAAWDGPVDALVANAGVMMIPERQVNAQGWEMQLATNYLGHFALVTGLRAALQAAERARVVVVSSGAQLLAGFDFDDPQFERRPYDPSPPTRSRRPPTCCSPSGSAADGRRTASTPTPAPRGRSTRTWGVTWIQLLCGCSAPWTRTVT